MKLTKIFNDQGDFQATYAAVDFMKARGFSVGSMQSFSPRGILFGDFCISKWRNMNAAEIKALHGVMRGDPRNGPVTVELFDHAPDEAKNAFANGEIA